MNNSETVQRAKTAPSTKLIRRPIVSSHALAFCQCDLVDRKNYPSKGYLWLFCFLDVYSRFLIAIPLRNKTAQSCAGAMETFVQRLNLEEWGSKLLSDQDTSFKAGLFQEVLEQYGIQHILATTYTKGGAMIERAQRTVREMVRTIA
jgi:transposase InsO family protein